MDLFAMSKALLQTNTPNFADPTNTFPNHLILSPTRLPSLLGRRTESNRKMCGVITCHRNARSGGDFCIRVSF